MLRGQGWLPPMWGAAGRHKALAAFAKLPKWCFPQPICRQAKGRLFGWVRKGDGSSQGGPGTSIPSPRDSQALPPHCLAQSRALEGHSRALSHPMRTGKGPVALCRLRWPCAGSAAGAPAGAGAPRGARAPGAPGARRGARVPTEAGAPEGAGGVCCSPGVTPVTQGPQSSAHPSAAPPRGPRGRGERPQVPTRCSVPPRLTADPRRGGHLLADAGAAGR